MHSVLAGGCFNVETDAHDGTKKESRHLRGSDFPKPIPEEDRRLRQELRDAGDYSLEDADVVAMLGALRKGDAAVIERVRKRLHVARDKVLVKKVSECLPERSKASDVDIDDV